MSNAKGEDAGSDEAAAGVSQLQADGYRFIAPVTPAHGDYDGQGHLNNAAVVRLFDEQRRAYIFSGIGAWWPREIGEQRYVVAARELHVLYESEGHPGERYVGGMKYVRVEGKATIAEQRIVEVDAGRAVARAWIVHLLVQDGRVVEWPTHYIDAVAEIEGQLIPVRPPRRDRRWGPPDSP